MSNLSDLIPAGGGQNNTDFVADGGITSGKPVILNSAGTVTQVAETSSPVTGALYDLETVVAGTQYSIGSCYDTAADKVVLCFGNSYNGTYMTSVVGTVTSENVVWETPVVISSVSTDFIDCCYNTTEGKVVAVGYQSYRPKVFVGTVTGSTIVWGTTGADAKATNGTWYWNRIVEWEGTSKVVWVGTNSGTGGYAAVGTISGTGTGGTSSWGTAQDVVVDGYNSSHYNGMCYDSGEGDQVLISYKITAGTNIGGWVRAATLSGTDISTTPTPIQFTSTAMGNYVNALAYDPVNDKALTVYGVDPNSGRTTFSRVVSTSGSTVSIGTETAGVFSGSNTATAYLYWRGLAYCTQTANFTFFYENFTEEDGYITTVSISGTTPVWSDDQTSVNGNETPDGNNTVVYDPDTKQAVVTYRDKGTSQYLRSGVYRIAGNVPTSNMTATNLLGIASGAILDTATGTINTWGSRNEVQTGLTIGSDYYVQSDGTITTASASPAQLIGTAISATQINIKDYTG